MTPLDYFVLAGYFVLTIALGSLTFARQKGLQDYFVASHSTPWLASMASLVATTISAVTFIGIPALSFKKDLTDLQIYLGFPVAAIAAAVLIVPFYYRQDILTAYQFLERRFDLKTRLLAKHPVSATRDFCHGSGHCRSSEDHDRVLGSSISLVCFAGGAGDHRVYRGRRHPRCDLDGCDAAHCLARRTFGCHVHPRAENGWGNTPDHCHRQCPRQIQNH
jgi:TM2 domain-containing membrane protein YozV